MKNTLEEKLNMVLTKLTAFSKEKYLKADIESELRKLQKEIVTLVFDKEHALILLQQPDEILAGGDVLAPLHAGLVMQKIEALQNRVGVDIQLCIFVIQIPEALIAIRRPFRVLTVIVHAVHGGEKNLDAGVQHSTLHIEFHRDAPVSSDTLCGGKALFEICKDIVDMLRADGEADRGGADVRGLQFFLGELRVGRGRRVDDQ